MSERDERDDEIDTTGELDDVGESVRDAAGREDLGPPYPTATEDRDDVDPG